MMKPCSGALLLTTMLAATAAAQPAPDRSALEIPDSLVIPGRAVYQLVTGGSKLPTYYGKAFPRDRTDGTYGTASLTNLPMPGSKDIYPTPVKHGGIRATTIEASAQHYGNVAVVARHVMDRSGWLASGVGELGAGLGHTGGAGWHREMLDAGARRVVAWNSAYDGGLRLETGRSGVWGDDTTSHRDYHKIALAMAADRTIDGNQLRLDVDLQQRGVGAPNLSASEQAIRVGMRWQRTNGRFWIRGRATGDFVRTARDLGDEGASSIVAVGVEAWTRPDENFGGGLGVTVYSGEYLAGDSLREIRPSLTAWVRTLDVAKFTIRLASGADRYGVFEAFDGCPMLDVSTPLRMPFRSLDFDVNGEVQLSDWNSASIGFRLDWIDDYPVWRRSGAGEPFSIHYDYVSSETASISAFYSRYRTTWRQGSLDLLAVWRSHSLAENPVPQVPDWEFHAVTALTARRGIVISPTVRLIGPRSYIMSNDRSGTLDSYFRVDVEGSAPFRQGWYLTAAIRNLLAQKYQRWIGSNEPGFHVEIGARRTW